MDAQRSGSRELSDWHRGSWEAEANALAAFGSGSYADAPIHCDFSEEDVLSLALLCDSAPCARPRQSGDILGFSKLEDPQLCQSRSEQTHIAFADSMGLADQSPAPRRESGSLLEEALTSIGMRQLLPQNSICHAPSDYAYSQLQSAAHPSSVSCMPYCSGSASVFVPCNVPQPLQEHKGQPAWDFQHELLSAGSRASSGTDGCVPELTQGSLAHVTIQSEACVPDYSTSRDGSPRMPPILQTHSPVTAINGHMQPRVAFLKLDEDCFSSDGEDRLALQLQPADAMPLIASDLAPTFHRKDCLQRYRDKKQRRHFSHKVRYTARKLNADRRPRYKGRFIKAADLSAQDLS